MNVETKSRLASGLGLVLSVLACAAEPQVVYAQAPAAPQPAAAEPAGYRELVTSAVVEHEAGHFAESRSLFEKAHALYPNARTFRGLGMAEFELRNYGASVVFLAQALTATVKPLDATLRDQTQQLLSRANGFVGRFVIQLSPPAATLTLNGSALLLDSSRALLLSAGDYTLDVSATGYTPEHKPLRVAGGEQATINLTLTPISLVAPAPVSVTAPAPGPATAATAPPKDEGEDDSLLASPWFWTAVGVVAVGAGVGIGIALGNRETRTTGSYAGSAGIKLYGP